MNEAWSNDYLGIPYKLGGRDRAGIDCWGLVALVYRELLELELAGHDAGQTGPEWLDLAAGEVRRLRVAWREVPAAAPGDVYVFRLKDRPCHVGLHVSPIYFLHSFHGNDTGLERFTSSWKRRTEATYRHLSRE